MKHARKITVLLTLFCYLITASVASAHGFSVLNQKPSGSLASQIVMADDSTGLDCHSSETSSGDNSNSTTCKIFCSVMAQAMTESNDSIALDVERNATAAAFFALGLSRQLSVETHPPK